MKIKTIILVLSICLGHSLNGQLEIDSLELVNLYNATNGEDWTNAWNLQEPVADWYGVYLTDNRLTALQLSGNNLVGYLPDLNLDKVITLGLQNNQLTDTIPDFSNLTKLKNLYLSGNTLIGQIPDFNTLPDLRIFECNNNQLVGNLPIFSNCPELEIFLCGDNNLTGSLPDFSHLEKLYFLNIHRNQFSGVFPPLPQTLSIFNCFGNSFTGPLPDLQQTPDIRIFDCSYNQLSGEIPNFQNLEKLEIFRCNDNDLSGQLPDFINLPKLTHFLCSENNFSGIMPDLSETPKLEQFYCDGNIITGSIPDYSHLTKLTFLHCHNNQLTGEIPDFSQWQALSSLLIQNNELSGSLPGETNQNLNQIRCYDNNLSGCFPDYICDLWVFQAQNNPLMPWLGDHEPFCFGESQIGAPCDDGLVETIDDSINENCECGDQTVSSFSVQEQVSITVSPNPAFDELIINSDWNADFRVQISDVNGNTIFEKVIKNHLDVSGFQPGIYFLTIEAKELNIIVNKKIIIQ